MKRRKKESLITGLVRVVRESDWMEGLLLRLRNWLEGQGPQKVARVVVAVLFVWAVGEVWLFLEAGDSVRVKGDFSAIHVANTVGAHDERKSGPSFEAVWAGLMADSVVKRSWDSLVRMRPGLMDTVKQLRRLDSADWLR